jgi:hypothetical protein
VEVLAPDIEGDFEILITLVQESVVWFDSLDDSNACSATVKIVRSGSSAVRGDKMLTFPEPVADGDRAS